MAVRNLPQDAMTSAAGNLRFPVAAIPDAEAVDEFEAVPIQLVADIHDFHLGKLFAADLQALGNARSAFRISGGELFSDRKDEQ